MNKKITSKTRKPNTTTAKTRVGNKHTSRPAVDDVTVDSGDANEIKISATPFVEEEKIPDDKLVRGVMPNGTVVWEILEKSEQEARSGRVVYTLHRDAGPAVETPWGTKIYYCYGKVHRLGGPAILWSYGDEEWRVNGVLHRIGGPAKRLADGSVFYYHDGLCHREDGPAVVRADGTEEWWLNGSKCDGPPSKNPK